MAKYGLCGDCLYAKKRVWRKGGKAERECRFNPPVVVTEWEYFNNTGLDKVWPTVEPDEGCGKFEPKPKESTVFDIEPGDVVLVKEADQETEYIFVSYTNDDNVIVKSEWSGKEYRFDISQVTKLTTDKGDNK